MTELPEYVQKSCDHRHNIRKIGVLDQNGNWQYTYQLIPKPEFEEELRLEAERELEATREYLRTHEPLCFGKPSIWQRICMFFT